MRKKNLQTNKQLRYIFFLYKKKKENQLENTGNECMREKKKKKKTYIHSLDAVARDDLSLDWPESSVNFKSFVI